MSTPKTDAACGWPWGHHGRIESSDLKCSPDGPFVHSSVARELERENAALREDERRLEYIFWPSGSSKARYWVRKLMESREYSESSPTIKIWRDAIDAARKEKRT